MSNAICTECSHEWSPRKKPEEIETPLCSQCSARGDSIEFEGVALEDDESAGPSIVERARREGQKAGLLGEIESLLGDLEELAPPGKEMPGEFRTQHVTLTTLRDGLEESERVSKQELDEAEGDLEAVRETVESHDDVQRVRDLRKQIEDLEREIEDLESERREKVDALELVKELE